MPREEGDFRTLLDARGLLRELPGHEFPGRGAAYTVFSQRPDAPIDVAEWTRHAERFVRARVGLTVEKRYDERAPRRDVARVVVAPLREEPGGTRVCWSRPRTDDDLSAARSAEGAAAGLAALAERCPQVWLVETEAEDDAVALRLSAILAGVLLGPILLPGGGALIGPKTARERLGD